MDQGLRPIIGEDQLSEEIKRWPVEAEASIVNINRGLAIARRLDNLAKRWRWTDRALGRRVQLVPGERPGDRRLKPAQLRKLLNHADARLADLIVILTLTGLRRSEALRPSKEDIRGSAVYVDHRSGRGDLVLFRWRPKPQRSRENRSALICRRET